MVKKSLPAKPTPALTAVELEMMSVIWRIGPCSVGQVREHLLPERELAYTSVSTMVRILEQKGYVASQKEGRGHLYHAAVSRESYQARSLKQFVSSVFDGTPSLLVRSLMDSDSLTSEELAQIRSILRRKGS
jgi:predicted transcriptional regulator